MQNIRTLTSFLRPNYDFITKNLSKEWINLEADKRPPLPSNDKDQVNRTADVHLPINISDIYTTLIKIRQHFKFDRLPDEWILKEYKARETLPPMDKLVVDIAKKTEQTVIIPITSADKIAETVKILRKYYKFHRLPSEFFRIKEIERPVMVFSENQFIL